MDFTIRNAVPSDLAQICLVENLAFPPAEAASEDAFRYRIQAFPQSFFVAEQNGHLIGLANGCATNRPFISDELYEPLGGHDPAGSTQMVFGLATHPDFRRRGVAEALLRHMIGFGRQAGKKRLALTCKKELIPYYEKFGLACHGVSASTHGDVVWYDMAMELS